MSSQDEVLLQTDPVVAEKSKKKKSKKSKKVVADDLDAFENPEDQLLNSTDPSGNAFDDAVEEDDIADMMIHIRVRQRNGKKTVTTMEGLPDQFDFKRILKYLKKTFACMGTVVEDEEHGTIIQLAGDQRQGLNQFLIEEGIAKSDNIKLHGF
ncbi:Eukaryotic translation initiation factor eIF-1 [Coemansia sp. Benny D115]|nr:Eukaryotic translation initiation factor eIF-1 [Coemansia sp. Benny D115]